MSCPISISPSSNWTNPHRLLLLIFEMLHIWNLKYVYQKHCLNMYVCCREICQLIISPDSVIYFRPMLPWFLYSQNPSLNTMKFAAWRSGIPQCCSLVQKKSFLHFVCVLPWLFLGVSTNSIIAGSVYSLVNVLSITSTMVSFCYSNNC